MIIGRSPVTARHGPPFRDQPPAGPPADEAARRIRRGGQRDVESGVRRGTLGRLIPHAPPRAVGPLMVSVIEAAFRTASMADLRRAYRAPTPLGATARRAVRMAAVTRPADGKDATAVAAGLLAKRLVHGVGARAAISDWTARPNRGGFAQRPQPSSC